MKTDKVVAVLLITILSGAFIFMCYSSYQQEKQLQQLCYALCIEKGGSETECKIFATFPGNAKLHLSNGEILSKD